MPALNSTEPFGGERARGRMLSRGLQKRLHADELQDPAQPRLCVLNTPLTDVRSSIQRDPERNSVSTPIFSQVLEKMDSYPRAVNLRSSRLSSSLFFWPC